MPAPVGVYVVVAVSTAAAGFAFVKFVYNPYIAPRVAIWYNGFNARRKSRARQDMMRRGMVQVPVDRGSSGSGYGFGGGASGGPGGQVELVRMRSSTDGSMNSSQIRHRQGFHPTGQPMEVLQPGTLVSSPQSVPIPLRHDSVSSLIPDLGEPSPASTITITNTSRSNSAHTPSHSLIWDNQPPIMQRTPSVIITPALEPITTTTPSPLVPTASAPASASSSPRIGTGPSPRAASPSARSSISLGTSFSTTSFTTATSDASSYVASASAGGGGATGAGTGTRSASVISGFSVPQSPFSDFAAVQYNPPQYEPQQNPFANSSRGDLTSSPFSIADAFDIETVLSDSDMSESVISLRSGPIGSNSGRGSGRQSEDHDGERSSLRSPVSHRFDLDEDHRDQHLHADDARSDFGFGSEASWEDLERSGTLSSPRI